MNVRVLLIGLGIGEGKRVNKMKKHIYSTDIGFYLLVTTRQYSTFTYVELQAYILVTN